MGAIALAVLLQPLLPAPDSAAAALGAGKHATFTFLSDPDDYIGAGFSRWFDRWNSSITFHGSRAEMRFVLDGGSRGEHFDVHIAAPRGELLTRRTYRNVMRASFREGPHAGLDISADHRGCNTVSGIIDVLDISFRQGVPDRLWIRFEQHCGGDIPSPQALFGEIRIGIDPVDAPAMAPNVVGWPDAYPDGWLQPVPTVTLLGPRSGTDVVTRVAVSGLHRRQFRIVEDRCTGVSLSRSRHCGVDVQFNPDGGGPKYGRLVVDLASGHRLFSSLQGRGIGGRTSIDLQSEEGDYLGLGGTYHYDPTNSSIVMHSNGDEAWGGVSYWDEESDGPEVWVGNFVPAFGERLTPGVTYFDDSAYGYPEVWWSGQGRACNFTYGEFTVDRLKLGATRTATVESLKIRFEARCGQTAPGLRGTIRYRVPDGDRSQPGPVSDLRAVRRGERIVLRWTNPPDADLAGVVVRRMGGTAAPHGPLDGIHAYAGAGATTTVRSRPAQSFSVFPLDAAGNVGPRRIIRVPGA